MVEVVFVVGLSGYFGGQVELVSNTTIPKRLWVGKVWGVCGRYSGRDTIVKEVGVCGAVPSG